MKKLIVLLSLILALLAFVSCDSLMNDLADEKETATQQSTTAQTTEEKTEEKTEEVTTEEVTTEEITTEPFLKHTIRSESPDIQLALKYRDGENAGLPKRGDPPKKATAIEKNKWLSSKLSLSGKYYGVDSISLLPSALNTIDRENMIDRDAFLQIPVYGADGRVNGLEPISTFGSYVYNRKGSAFYVNDEYGLRVLGTAQNGCISDIYGFLIDISFDTPLDCVPLTLSDSYMFIECNNSVNEDAIKGYIEAIRIAIIDSPNGYIYKYARLDMSQIEKTDKGYIAKIQVTDADNNPIDDGYIMDLHNYITPNVSVFVYVDGNVINNQDVMAANFGIKLGFDICFK